MIKIREPLNFDTIETKTITGNDGNIIVIVSSEYESDVAEIFTWLTVRELPVEKLMIDFGTNRKGAYYVWDSENKTTKKVDGRSKEMLVFKKVLAVAAQSGIPKVQESLQAAFRKLMPRLESVYKSK